MTNPASITPRELLLLAVEVLDNWPEAAATDAPDDRAQHPDDAYSTARLILDTVTASRIAAWQRNRRTATAT